MAVAAGAASDEVITVRLQAIRVADDDGGRPAAIDAELFGEWVSFANTCFAPTGIVFTYDPATDFADVRNTLLNNIADPNDTFPDWRAQGTLGNEIAAQYPDKILVVVRHGPGPISVYGGSGDPAHGFIILPGLEGWISCGVLALRALPHELGHYFGLGHTLAREFTSVAEAEQHFKDNGRDPSVFDGDGFSDTPPDPDVYSLNCESATTEITLDGVRFELPRDNLMSYYTGSTLTPMQGAAARVLAKLLVQHHCKYPWNVAAVDAPAGTLRFEAEDLPRSSTGAAPGQQDMSWFTPYPFSPHWNGDDQLLWCGAIGKSVTLYDLYVPHAGLYTAVVYATLAPDYGIVGMQIDGKTVGTPIDGYAPDVRPTGPVEVCPSVQLAKGSHSLTFTMVGTNSASRGELFGIDCVELRPVGR
jgi:hypothetical protein